MEFSSSKTKRIYNDRVVDSSWKDWCLSHLDPEGKDVIDIGCGSGIYSAGFLSIGARSVIGIDKSQQYIEEAKESSIGNKNVIYKVGNAVRIDLPDKSADIVFERALIHHLSADEQIANVIEAKRVLRANGLFFVQNRTLKDVQANDPSYWIRATLFDVIPGLLEFEKNRRPSINGYSNILRSCGFKDVHISSYAEIRKEYTSFEELEDEIMNRKGKSTLFQLSEDELKLYCSHLKEKSVSMPLIERDLWSTWTAEG